MSQHYYNNDATYLLYRLMQDFDFIKFSVGKKAASQDSYTLYSDISNWHDKYQDWLKNEYKFTNEKNKERYEEHLKAKEML